MEDKVTQSEKLYQWLKRNPKGASIRDLRNDLWIQNVMEAKRQANKKWVEPGEIIETFEIRKTQNGRPVNGYRLKVKDPNPVLPPVDIQYLNAKENTERQENQARLLEIEETRQKAYDL